MDSVHGKGWGLCLQTTPLISVFMSCYIYIYASSFFFLYHAISKFCVVSFVDLFLFCFIGQASE